MNAGSICLDSGLGLRRNSGHKERYLYDAVNNPMVAQDKGDGGSFE